MKLIKFDFNNNPKNLKIKIFKHGRIIFKNFHNTVIKQKAFKFK